MIRVVERLDQLLNAFSVEAPERTLTECAEHAGLTKSSAYRLLQSLQQIGLVERRDLMWRLGPKAVSLAIVRLGMIDVRRDAMTHLRRLRLEFRAATAFSVPEGSDMIYLDRLDSPDAHGVSARLGGRAPMWAGGSGKAVLARMDPAERQLRLDVDEWRRLPQHVRDQVLEDVGLATEQGYYVDRGEFYSGIGGVCVAICDAHGDPVAGLSVILPTGQLTDDFTRIIAERLLAVVAELEQTITYSAT